MRAITRILLAVFLAAVLAAFGYVHWFLPARVEATINVNLPHAAYVIDAETEAFHDSLFVADLHADSLLWKRDLLSRSEVGHLDVPRLLEGNVALQVFSATTKSPEGQNYERNSAGSDRITRLAILSFWPPRTWNSLFERARYQLDKLKRFADKSDALTLVTDRASLRQLLERRASGERVVGALYLIEGAHPLEGDIDKLDRLYDEGLRIVGLTHFFDNETGGSLHGLSGEGLSDFGRAVVSRAAELEMIVDVAHASPAMVRDVLDMSKRPVLLSHGGVKAACDTPRNLDDDLMREIAANGGLLGVGFWDAAVCDPSPAGVARAILRAVELMGAEHVALGSDYDGAVAVSFDASELAALTQELRNLGLPPGDIRLVMGGNVQRFLLENLPK